MGDCREQERVVCREEVDVTLVKKVDAIHLGSAKPTLVCGASSLRKESPVDTDMLIHLCRQCNCPLALEEVEEPREMEDSEDCVDGIARCVKVIIKCQCHSRLSFVREYTGTFVIQGSSIMRRYLDDRSRRATRSRRMLPVATPKDFHVETMELCITNPYAQGIERSVNIGAMVTSLKDERGHIRHFVNKVTGNTPAHNMEIMFEDELMLCNGQLLVDKTADELAMIFADVFIDEEFTLLTRRINDPTVATHNFDIPDSSQYEYWQIRATITIDPEHSPILAERASVTRAAKGDILAVYVNDKYKNGQKVWIKMESGWLRNVDGVLQVSQLERADPSFQFEMFSYDMTIMEEKPQTRRARLFRHSPASGQPCFFYVSKTGNIKLKDIPHKKYSNPSKSLFLKDKCHGNYCIRNTIFFSSDVSNIGEQYFLEAFVKRGCYMSHEGAFLALTRVGNADDLYYKDNVKFEVVFR